jgi:hypothetical protein|tara:strand:+ start:3346 stop:3537 length:192 start_codon:yes stop_codon:yes gene_type:complete
MFDKNTVLLIIAGLLLLFYLVIRLGVGKKKDINDSKNLTTYLNGVRILILFIGMVSLVLWFFI